MTEIYDVTDADTDAVQSPNERALNKELEFDNDWSTELLADNDELDIDAIDDDELADKNIFSDPESEWRQQSVTGSGDESDDVPESERVGNNCYVTYA